jgi:predicted amidohydrolase
LGRKGAWSHSIDAPAGAPPPDHESTLTGGAFVVRYPAAAVQFEPRFAQKVWNVERLVELTRDAALAGARLVVLPEMATTGYCFTSRIEIAPYVELVPDGPTVRRFEVLAAELAVYIVLGLAEVEPSTGAYYNTAALIGPGGYIGQYRKLHSYIDETRWARDGDLGIPVFETELGRIAIQICMDLDYMEPCRIAALSGADVIAFVTNWIDGDAIWRARALENGLYVIAANRWGEERGTRFCGNSQVIDPRGVALNLISTGDGVAVAEVETDVARAARTAALAVRQPQAYQELLLSGYLWRWQESKSLPPGRLTAVAVGGAMDGTRMADEVRWADYQARDRGWAKLDLAVFPLCASPVDQAPLATVARALDCHIVWGEPEGPHQIVRLMGPMGLVGEYRPVHASAIASPGEEGFMLFDLPWGRLGLLEGSELAIPEAARILALRGADLIAVPASCPAEDDRVLWGARSIENGTVVVVANAPGGRSVLVPGRRPVWATAPGSVILEQIDTSSEQIRAKELLRKLQPRWYDPLVSK